MQDKSYRMEITNSTPIIAEVSEHYRATLKMLGDVIVNCKDEIWQKNSQDVIISQFIYHYKDA